MRALHIAISLAAGLCLGIILTFGKGKLETPRSPRSDDLGSNETVDRPTRLPVARRLEEFIVKLEDEPFGQSTFVQGRALEVNLAQFCGKVEMDELPDLFETVSNLDEAMLDPTLALTIIGARWAESDPHAASEAARQLDMTSRAAVERAIWPVWARRDLRGFRTHMENLRVELGNDGVKAGAPFGDGAPWVKVDPLPAMEAYLEGDLRFFKFAPNTEFEGAPPLTALPLPPAGQASSGSFGPNEGVSPMLDLWLKRDPSSAMTWARDAIARDKLQPRYRFLLLDQLSLKGYESLAADLALNYLTEDLQVIALDRILKRWMLSDPLAARRWQKKEGLLAPHGS
ncbi:MAG: hypothetical protein R3F19_28180 [Verrucomicrobiales bacterium]